MSNGEAMNAWERFVKLWFMIGKMIMDGVRDIEKVIAVLQAINDGDCKPEVVLGQDIWARAYAVLGMSAKYGQFILAHGFPDKPDLWVVPVLQGVTCYKVVSALRKVLREAGYNVRTYVEDLDANVPTNDRDPNGGSYFVGFAMNVEADEENKSKSASTLAEAGHKGITLLERLLLELGYFLATKELLDVKNITLCTGSRVSNGNVPCVGGYPGYRKVYVCWCSPGSSDDNLRSRSAVPMTAEPR